MKKTAAFLLSAFACLFLLSGCNDALDGGAQSGSETTESADISTTVDDDYRKNLRPISVLHLRTQATLTLTEKMKILTLPEAAIFIK